MQSSTALGIGLGAAVACVALRTLWCKAAQVSPADGAPDLGAKPREKPTAGRNGTHLAGEKSRCRGAPTQVKLDCASTVQEYMTAAERSARRGDKVLVIGSLCEPMMDVLAQRTAGAHGEIIQLDMTRKDGEAFSAGTAKIAHLRIITGDFADVRFLLELAVPFDLIFCDLTLITGNDLLLDQVAYAHLLSSLFSASCRQLVMKSRALMTLANHTATSVDFCNAVAAFRAAAGSRGVGGEYEPLALPVLIGGHGVAEYRKAALAGLLPTDTVLEIGCHSGATTRLVHAALRAMGGAGEVVGVDIGKSIIELARKHGPADIRYEVVDAWDTLALLALSTRFSVILVDVGGISSHHGLIEALSLLRQLRCAYALHCRLLVAKSKCIRDFGLHTRPASRLWRAETDVGAWRYMAERVVALNAA